MIRRNTSWIAGAFCLATTVGCGGNAASDLFPSQNNTLISLGRSVVAPVYFGMTNTVLPKDGARVFGVDLVAGAEVQLEVATVDSTSLVFELHRVRKDGSTELLAPVDVNSGFYLSTFEASSDDQYVLYFPKRAGGDPGVVIYFLCQSGDGRCTAERQPNESCAPGFACAPGLACELPPNLCNPWTQLGTCSFPPAACQDEGGPSCGCDGKTYDSACVARSAGVGVAHEGQCLQ
jgi:hypothetical protein